MMATVKNTSLADRGFMNVSHLVPAEIHEPVMKSGYRWESRVRFADI
ncbi:hypothetical protein SAMN05216338_106345 [Bradyrhizobium sp. Rc2d]|nr:hypothetical protein SAMN05216338_106345 [Bradyrhizobium sp. Rc2d]